MLNILEGLLQIGPHRHRGPGLFDEGGLLDFLYKGMLGVICFTVVVALIWLALALLFMSLGGSSVDAWIDYIVHALAYL